MGSVYSRLGAKVTVVEFLDGLCPGTDKEVAKEFQKVLKKQGFKFKFKTKVAKRTPTTHMLAFWQRPCFKKAHCRKKPTPPRLFQVTAAVPNANGVSLTLEPAAGGEAETVGCEDTARTTQRAHTSTYSHTCA